MVTTNISAARTNLYQLAEDAILSHEPITITSKKGNIVMLVYQVDEMQKLIKVIGMFGHY